ncbi:MAG TPA: pyridoxamine 5'-phosphate oxidase family protein [Jatrophihabitantaceae bacterium]|nr:pyridoxamine 5'-phosphate oxidase family protein [Jatrophihabitantaceae bacterium]
MSRRAEIQMSDAEVTTFLDEQRTMTCATFGPRGWPHLAPLWYVLRDGRVWAWTFTKSQKALDLVRDPRATLQVEAGEQYDQLQGVTFECDAVLHREVDVVAELGIELLSRYAGVPTLPDAAVDGVHKQAPKRVALEFVERRRASWDHRKLPTGVY